MREVRGKEGEKKRERSDPEEKKREKERREKRREREERKMNEREKEKEERIFSWYRSSIQFRPLFFRSPTESPDEKPTRYNRRINQYIQCFNHWPNKENDLEILQIQLKTSYLIFL